MTGKEPRELTNEELNNTNIDNLAFITYTKDPRNPGLKKLSFASVRRFFNLIKMENIAKLVGLDNSWNVDVPIVPTSTLADKVEGINSDVQNNIKPSIQTLSNDVSSINTSISNLSTSITENKSAIDKINNDDIPEIKNNLFGPIAMRFGDNDNHWKKMEDGTYRFYPQNKGTYIIFLPVYTPEVVDEDNNITAEATTEICESMIIVNEVIDDGDRYILSYTLNMTSVNGFNIDDAYAKIEEDSAVYFQTKSNKYKPSSICISTDNED